LDLSGCSNITDVGKLAKLPRLTVRDIYSVTMTSSGEN